MNQEETRKYPSFSLSLDSQLLLGFASFFLVAFGQPAWLPWNGFVASGLGFALFWRVLLAYPLGWHRFFLAAIWFSSIQLVQLSWFVSHPYWYIYAVYFIIAAIVGVQFGIFALFIRPEKFTASGLIQALSGFLPITALWTVFEWIRLFPLSGLSWNPVGIAMTGSLYGLQAASLAGVFGLSFWVMLVNFLALWAWIQKRTFSFTVWMAALALPYFYGIGQVAYHGKIMENGSPHLTALLVQTAFAPEEAQEFSGKGNLVQHVIREWEKILETTKKHKGTPIDLIVLPEFVVPYGTYSDVYPLVEVKKIFVKIFGNESLASLPKLEHPFFSRQGAQFLVNNAYWIQALANHFHADVLVGLEDAEDMLYGIREYYSAAIFIHPQPPGTSKSFFAQRYSKRVLVPMGEYIPFEACRKLAERYGVFGSFTCGKEAVVMQSHGISFSPSICYEETFGDLMREGRQKGAELLVNLTSDVWYPNSKLPRQHLDHARLRTVENGVPLVRACNTGITAAVDSLGRDIAVLGGEYPEQVEWISDSLLVEVPIYTYSTLYSHFGDSLIIGFSVFILIFYCTRSCINHYKNRRDH